MKLVSSTLGFSSGMGSLMRKKATLRARIGNPKESECKKPKNPILGVSRISWGGAAGRIVCRTAKELVRFPIAYPRKVLKDKFMNPNHSLAILILTLFQAHFLFGQSLKSLKVFVLAGQSNMEGKGAVDPLLNHQIKAPETRKLFAHLHSDGKYLERGDVWIDYLGRRGNLTVGYGSPGKIGPELEFGHTMVTDFRSKCAYYQNRMGGKSLGRDFRPRPVRVFPRRKRSWNSWRALAKREFNNLLKRMELEKKERSRNFQGGGGEIKCRNPLNRFFLRIRKNFGRRSWPVTAITTD